MFLPFAQTPYASNAASRYAYLTLVARASCGNVARCDASQLTAPITAAVRGLERGVPISAVQTMESVVDRATSESRFYVLLLTSFAAIALGLAAVGIYGVMSYSVSRRTNEIGIRIALGAEPAALVRQILAQGLKPALAGAAAGVAGALALTGFMTKLLYGVAATDALTFVSTTAALFAVAVAATYVPARRAARIDPLVALRAD
jgi:putative ABC transport system permease protein